MRTRMRMSSSHASMRLHGAVTVTVGVALLLLVAAAQSVSGAFAPRAAAMPACMSTAPYWCSDVQVDDASVAASTARVEVGDATSDTTATLDARARLSGRMRFAVEPYNGQHLLVSAEDAAAGRFERRLRVVLPHSEDDLFGCTPFNHSVTDEGDAMAGSFVLIQRRGGCLFVDKMTAAEGAGAAVAAIYNCDDCDDEVVRMANNDVQSVMGVFVAGPDARLLREYLLARRQAFAADPAYSGNFSAPLYVTINGTGALVAEERAALTTMSQHLALVAADLSDTSQLRPWTDLVDKPEIDPCLDRIAGVYCEGGHVHSIYLRFLGVNGMLHDSVGDLLHMQFLSISENEDNGGLTGAIPDTLCRLRQLRSLQLEGNLLESIPDCLGADQPLQVLSVDRNRLPSLPASITQAAATLVKFTAASNALRSLPAGLSSLMQLRQFDAANNPELGASINVAADLRFDTWTQLTDFAMSSCGLRGQLWPQMFDGCALLQRVELSDNQLEGGLPNLAGASLPVEGAARLSGALWSFSSNGFTGGVPSSWAGSGTVSVALDHNLLVGPLEPLGLMDRLAYLRLQNNRITLLPEHDGLIDVLLFNIVGLSLVELYLSHNLLEGDWDGNLLSSTPSLSALLLGHNRIASVPIDVFDSKITVLDMSHNRLSGELPGNINSAPPYVSSLSFQGNPDLVAWPLPTWLKFAEPPVWLAADASGTYECRSLATPTTNAGSFHIEVDARFTDYQGCRCARGRFGVPPLCDQVPVQAALFPFGEGVLSNETALQAEHPQFFPNLLRQYDDGGRRAPDDQELGVNCSAALGGGAVEDGAASVSAWPSSFTDEWYGSDRLTAGLSTFWSIDLQRLRRDVASGQEIAAAQALPHTAIDGRAALQPVRHITVRLHVSGAAFKGARNQLVVYEGLQESLGAAMLTLSGDNVRALAVPANTSVAHTGAYQCRYGSSLRRLAEPVYLVEVDVPSNGAAVYFGSRDAADAHFVATYSYSFTCAAGLELSDGNLCMPPEVPRDNIVVIVISVAAGLLLLSFGWVMRERYRKQRRKANQALEARQSSDYAVEEEEQRVAAQLQAMQENNMKREMASQILSFCLETALLITSWVSAGALLEQRDATVGEGRVTIAYLTCTILSLMSYLLISGTRAVQLQSVAAELQMLRTKGAAEDLSFDMGVVQRRLLQLSIISSALLFDAIPMLVLNFYRAATTDGPTQARFLFQCFLGSFLLGVKVIRLAESGTLKRQLLELQLKKLTKLEQRKQSMARSRTHTALPNFNATTSAPQATADHLSPLPGHGQYVDRISMSSPLRPSVALPTDSVDVELADVRSPSGAGAAAGAAAAAPLDDDFHVDDEEQMEPPPPPPPQQQQEL